MYRSTLPKVIKGTKPDLLRSSISQSFITFPRVSWEKKDLQVSRISWFEVDVVWIWLIFTERSPWLPFAIDVEAIFIWSMIEKGLAGLDLRRGLLKICLSKFLI